MGSRGGREQMVLECSYMPGNGYEAEIEIG